MSNNLDLIKVIADRIANSTGDRITFAEYMDLALYHPEHGYYASKSGIIGEAGDFLTSPHLADDFGEMLAVLLERSWQLLGKLPKFQIVEMGAGKGLLALQILNYSRQVYPAFFQAIEYLIIEASPAMRASQQNRLKDLPVRWVQWEEITDRSIGGCFLSNELIDAFPVHQVIVSDGKLQEIYVTKGDDGNFAETIGALSTEKLSEYWQLNGINLLDRRYPDRYRTEVNLAALSWLELVDRKLDRGYIISIDYGYSADRYYNPIRSTGTLQCYYRHAYHNDPYINIGNQDLTAHVDFTALQNYGESLGLQTVEFTQQALLLMSLGLGERIAAISATDTSEIQSLLRRRQNLHQLIDPMGLGKFGVLIQGRGLTAKEGGLVSPVSC